MSVGPLGIGIGIYLGMPRPSGGEAPPPSAPVFTVQPSISPATGTAGETEFTANDGSATSTSSYARRWLLDAVEIGTGATITPDEAGSLVVEVTATGPGGSTVATSEAVAVAEPIPEPTEPKWQHYAFRASSPPYSGAVDPNDETQATNVFLADQNYSTGPLSEDGYAYGGFGSTPVANNASSGNAGNNPLLGGSHSRTSGATSVRIARPVGTHSVKLAMGAVTVGARTLTAIFNAVLSDLNTALGGSIAGSGIFLWQASTGRNANHRLVSPVDGSVWRVPSNYTSGTTAPSGAGPTFMDNSVALVREAPTALLVIDATTTAANQVVDIHGNVIAASAWAASEPMTLECTSGEFCFLKLCNAVFFPRCVSFLEVTEPEPEFTAEVLDTIPHLMEGQPFDFTVPVALAGGDPPYGIPANTAPGWMNLELLSPEELRVFGDAAQL